MERHLILTEIHFELPISIQMKLALWEYRIIDVTCRILQKISITAHYSLLLSYYLSVLLNSPCSHPLLIDSTEYFVFDNRYSESKPHSSDCTIRYSTTL